ncbi:MAG: glycosyltransferase family 9 protein [Flavobacteriales bacterium]
MKKFLIIQTAFIGDVILATAVAEKLHVHFPESRIDFMLRKGNEGVLKNHPFIHKLYIWDKKVSKYSGLFQTLRAIRKEKYSAVINLQRYAASGFVTAFSKADERIGFDKNPLSFLFDKKFRHRIGSSDQPGEHEVQRCLHLIDHLTNTDFIKPKLYPSHDDTEFVKSFQNQPYLTISPASVWFTKQYPKEGWINLINTNSEKRIFLLGGPGDKELCENICDATTNEEVKVLAGSLSLLQSAALMQGATMNYCNDSAPLHLCSAMNAPVRAAFCSTIPEFGFGPLSDGSKVFQTSENLACRPCGLHGYQACPQGHFKCSHFDLE